MTDYIERFASSSAPKFADFGHMPGIHFPAAESAPSGDVPAPPAAKPAPAPESAPAVTSPDGGGTPVAKPEESKPADAGSRHADQVSTPEAGVKPALPSPAHDVSPLPEGAPKPSTTESVVAAPEQGSKHSTSAPTDNATATVDLVSAPGPIASAIQPKPTASDSDPGVRPRAAASSNNPEKSTDTTPVAVSVGSLVDNAGSKKEDSTKVRSSGETAESGSMPDTIPAVKPHSNPAHGTSDKPASSDKTLASDAPLSSGKPLESDKPQTSDKPATPESSATRTDVADVSKPAPKSSLDFMVSSDRSPLPTVQRKHGDPTNTDSGKAETDDKDSPTPLKSLLEGVVSSAPKPGERTEVKPHASDNTTDDLKRKPGSAPTAEVGSLDTKNGKLPEAVPSPAPTFELPKATAKTSLETSDKKDNKPTTSSVGEMLGGFAITDGLRTSQAKHTTDGEALPVVPSKVGENAKKGGDVLETAASLLSFPRKSVTDNTGGDPSPTDGPKPTLPKLDLKLDFQLPNIGGTPGDSAPTQTRPTLRNTVTMDNLFGAIAPAESPPQVKQLFELPKTKPLNHPTTEVVTTDPVVLPRQLQPAVEHFPKPLTPENTTTAPSALTNLIEIQTRRTAEIAIQSALLPKDAATLPTILPSPSPKSVGEVVAAPIIHKETLPPQTMTNFSVNPFSATEEQRLPRVSSAAVQFISASADGLIRKPVDNTDQTKKAFATTSDVSSILSGAGKLNNKVEDSPSPTPRPERTSADSPVSPLHNPTKAERNNNSDNGNELPRPAGGVSPVAETSKPVFTPQPAFKSAALDRNTTAASQEVASKVVSLDVAKSVNAALDSKTVYSLDNLKTPIIGLNGRDALSIPKSFEGNGLTAKNATLGAESIKTAAIEVLPLGVKRLNPVTDSVVKTIGQTLGTLDGVKIDSVSVNGMKTSLINFVSVQPLTAGDKSVAVKTDLSPIKVEIPTAGISNGAFINGATFNTSHGVAGSIKIDVSGVGREGPIAISAVKDAAVKVEGTSGFKPDAISGVKDGSIAIIHTTSTGKFINVDITATAKTDSNVTTGSVSINGTTIQPTATSIKGDANVPGKADATGRPNDGVKCGDFVSGTVRGTVLTPSIASAIANAIRFGYPIPEGITLENGTFSVTYGNEVLYFPGLRAALKFAEVVGLIDAESDSVAGEKDESHLKPTAGANVRVRYSVKAGESLQSIAETELGDERFADLIMTINRSEILYRLTDEGKVPFVYPGQLILLPSEQELNIYRKNIFGKNGTKGSAMSGVSSAEVTVEDESRESGRAVRKALHDEYIANNIALQPGRPKTTVRDMPKFQLSFNNIGPVVTEEDDAQDYTHTVVNLPVKTEEHQTADNSSSDMRMVLDSRTDEPASGSSVIKLSVIGEQAVFLHASVDGAERNDTVVVNVEPVVEMERLLDVRALANGVRALVTEVPKNPGQFFIRLEVRINDSWTVIASYDGFGDSTRRVRHAENGTKTSMQVNLPAHAVKTMAIEDFARNWSTYKANYENNNIGRIQVDSVQPMPISLRGSGSLAASR